MRVPFVSGSQSVPSAFFTKAVGRRAASAHSVSSAVAGSKREILKPPSWATQRVPSASFRRWLGAASRGIAHFLTFFSSAEIRERTFSFADAVQMVPSVSRIMFEAS